MEHRFASFPSYQQIIMVTNELNRANNHRENMTEYKACLERGLELLDFIIDDSEKWRLKYRELLRARRYLAQRYLQSNIFEDTSTLQRALHQLDPEATRRLGLETNPPPK
ncbi:MAG: hypothetical protein K9M55_06385 [Candidatus Marinimicrobia bacterium]|nr:hypothetical protein [Candidatus Neomarinimicrobiota bacterium]MCF7922312.1 hypothetical protein [Candidatus Neomarinimicrobiota bacterium]